MRQKFFLSPFFSCFILSFASSLILLHCPNNLNLFYLCFFPDVLPFFSLEDFLLLSLTRQIVFVFFCLSLCALLSLSVCEHLFDVVSVRTIFVLYLPSISLSLSLYLSLIPYVYMLLSSASVPKLFVFVVSFIHTLRDSVCFVFIGVGKFCITHSLRQVTQDTKIDYSCLQTSLTSRNVKLNIVGSWPSYNVTGKKKLWK